MKEDDIPTFNLERVSFPVKIVDKDKKTKKIFVMEMSGAQRSEYLSQMTKSFDIDIEKGTAKSVSTESIKNIQIILLSLSVVDDKGNPIPIKQIEAYPNALFKFLFRKSKEINTLGEEENDKRKKA